MKKLLILLLVIFLNSAYETQAEEGSLEDNALSEQEADSHESEMDTSENENTLPEEINELSNKEAFSKTEVEINRSLEQKKINMPLCDDENLLEVTKDYIVSYFRKSQNEGTLYRRYRHFILQNINQFREENIANYKSAQTRPVSDIITDIKINKGVAEENIRLCKNYSKDRFAGKMYMIIYPSEANVFQVQLINLTPQKNETANFIFTTQD